MDLDARELLNPIQQQKKRIMEKAVDQELRMLKNRILMASKLGYQECRYSVLPTFQFPNPSQEIIPRVCDELIKCNFRVYTGANHSVLVRWGQSSQETRK